MDVHASNSPGTFMVLGWTWANKASRLLFEPPLTRSSTSNSTTVSGTAAEAHGKVPNRVDGRPSADDEIPFKYT